MKKVIGAAIVAVIVIGAIFWILNKKQYTSEFASLESTHDIAVSSVFMKNTTVSPNDAWLVYVSQSSQNPVDGEPDYRISVLNLKTSDKYTLSGTKEIQGSALAFALYRDCWSQDSHYCYFGNDTNLAIDFSGEAPILTEKISPEKLTCSDCLFAQQEQDFSNRKHGYILLSPNQQYSIKSVSTGNGFVSAPSLYLVKNGKETFIGKNIYDVNWSADSKFLYLFKCDTGGGCGSSPNDHLYKLDIGKI